jgi:hypothetical protein
MTPLPGGFDLHLDYRLIPSIKALLAMSAAVVLYWDYRFRQPTPVTWPPARRRRLVAIGLLSLAAWWNFGALHGSGRPLHLHDFFHYYIGSKYFAELGYSRIYQCTAVVEVDEGRARAVEQRWTRNLHTNQLERHLPTPAESAECRARLGPKWSEFRHDVEWFRAHMAPRAWDGIPMVFGHNATPAWNALGYWLTTTGPASNAQVLLLGALDPILIVCMFVLLWRTFGVEAACVAAVWFGLNEASAYTWIGGGFLRADVSLCVVAGVCALRSGRGVVAGLAFGAAALLRAFPLFILAGIGVKVLHDLHRRGWQSAWLEWRGFVGGVSLAATILLAVAAATWAPGWGSALEPWKGFATNSRKHLGTPITNHVGLKPALWFEWETRGEVMGRYWNDGPWDTWREARTSVAARRAPIRYVIAAAFLALFVVSVRRTPPWVAAVTSIALLPFATTLANYYYALLLLFGVLWIRDKAIGLALACLTLLTTVLPPILEQRDDRYVVISIAVVLFAFFTVDRVRRMEDLAVASADQLTAATAPAQ